jgi:hypothetical protein
MGRRRVRRGGRAAARIVAGVALTAVMMATPSLVANRPGAAAAPTGPIVVSFGDARSYGPSGTAVFAHPVVGMAATPTHAGYWLVSTDGGIFAFGDARFFGSTGGLKLNQPIVGMAATPTGGGYWLFSSDGGIFAFGDARFFGSTGSLKLNQPIVGMAATPTGGGYWLVASDGGIFAFGDARFFGSTGDIHLNEPIVGMAADDRSGGYWMVARDGGMFSFRAPFHGSAGRIHLAEPVVGMAVTPDRGGYWMVASDGGVFTFGDAGYYGSGTGRLGADRRALDLIPSALGHGYDILATPAVAHIGFAGDVNGVGRVAAYMSQGGNPLAGVQGLFEANDANIVNLETAVGSSGQAQVKQYTFHSPPVLLSHLKASGVTVVNLANNHSLDFGPQGLLETISDARAAGLQVVGAGANSAAAFAPAVVDTPGGTVAFLGFSQVVPSGWAATANSPSVASAYDTSAVVDAVRSARARADYVVVMMHAGIELDQCPTPDQLSLVSTLVDAGADVVVGGHPHVLQGLTRVGGDVVDYSMGNFVFYDGAGPTAATGVLTVGLAPGRSESDTFSPAEMDSNGSPQLLSGPAAAAAVANVDSLAPGAGRC